MKRMTREKIVVLVLSFVLFAGGVWALSMDRGPARMAVLALVLAGLCAVAVRQTMRIIKKK